MNERLLGTIFVLLFATGLCIGKREQCEFVLRNESSKAVAVRMNMTAEIDILYAVGNPESRLYLYQTVPVPCNASIDGDYNATSNDTKGLVNTLYLTWDHNNGTYELLFEFVKNTKDKEWKINTINVTVPVDSLNNSTSELEDIVASATKDSLDSIGSVDYKRSYQCKALNNLTMSIVGAAKGNENFTVSLPLSNLRIQAFEFSNLTAGNFGKKDICFQDIRGNKIIPIIVGAVLGAGVVIVLLVYLGSQLKNRIKKSSNSYQLLN